MGLWWVLLEEWLRKWVGFLEAPSWVVRATCCPDARSAQEAIVFFGYGTETLPVAFGDPGNK